MNKEALSLLNWLTSSQAANDVTSDDDLMNEAILTPLFPKKTYQSALEAAHQDFETASMRECQDILDSVEIHNTRSKETSSTSASSDDFFVIPQVDGSTDEKEHITPYKDMKKIVKRSREKKSPWGVLPVSVKKREVGSSSTSPFVESNLNLANCEVNRSLSDCGESGGSVPSPSVRDLMRMQRVPQFDVCESSNSIVMLDSDLSSRVLSDNPIERKGSIEMAYTEKPPMREQIEDFNFCLEPTTNGINIFNLYIVLFPFVSNSLSCL
jgi:hypothetical protein